MSFLAGMLIGGLVGFFLGVVLTCILLCKKNLEIYSEIGKKAGQAKDSAVTNVKAMKNVYKQAIDEYENGTPAPSPSYEESEQEAEYADDEEYIDE